MIPKGGHRNKARAKAIASRRPRIYAVDLFCGVGGLTHGLVLGGVRVKAGVDLDAHCQFPYEANNHADFHQADVQDLTGADLDKMFGRGSVRLLAGCAPCQPFSTYSRKGRRLRDDAKWDLIADFGRLARESKPQLITMENVPQLLDHSVFKEFLSCLKGYHTSWQIVECADYGVPQTRKRLVLIASRFGSVQLLTPREFGASRSTVRDAIAHLRTIEAGQVDSLDGLHTSCSLSTLNLRRIRASVPGGTWRDWNDELIAACHRKTSGQTYPSVYGRMEWDEPAPTVTTQCYGFGNGRFGHPEQDRAISLREAAILQTFPDDYRFVAPRGQVRFNRLGRLIGNAVPVRLGQLVAKSLSTHLRTVSPAQIRVLSTNTG